MRNCQRDTIISHSPDETLRAGSELGSTLRSGDVVALCGDLGSGKTHYVKGVAMALGTPGEITSPTFTLVHECLGGRLPLIHIDLYRIESELEMLEIGFEEYVNGKGVTIIEWADKFRRWIPIGSRWIQFCATSESTREIRELS